MKIACNFHTGIRKLLKDLKNVILIPMAIVEIWIPEAIIVLFLVLPLLRPFVKLLVPLDGLLWLPFIALLITIGIFPAYGFRPECLLTLVFAFVYSITYFLRPKDSFLDRGLPLTVCLIVALGIAAVPMFIFYPRVNQSAQTESFRIIKLSNQIKEYSVRVYGPVSPDKPLLFIIPPEIGSVNSVELICSELNVRGYSVVTYSAKSNVPFQISNNGWKRSNFPARLLRYWFISGRKANLASVNEKGKELESEQRAEIEFLLSRLPGILDSSPPVLLAAYGPGGSALAYLAGDNGFALHYSTVLGAVAIESRLWSSYLPESRVIVEVPDDNIRRYWIIVINWLNNFRPLRISRSGSLPGEGHSRGRVSADGVPVLYLLSGRALDFSNKPEARNPYQAVFDTLHSGSGPAALAVIQEAGPLDYQDYPVTHPLYSFLLPGQKGAGPNADPIGDTASIIGNYASFLLEDVSRETLKSGRFPRHPISGSLYIESKGLPGFRLQ